EGKNRIAVHPEALPPDLLRGHHPRPLPNRHPARCGAARQHHERRVVRAVGRRRRAPSDRILPRDRKPPVLATRHEHRPDRSRRPAWENNCIAPRLHGGNSARRGDPDQPEECVYPLRRRLALVGPLRAVSWRRRGGAGENAQDIISDHVALPERSPRPPRPKRCCRPGAPCSMGPLASSRPSHALRRWDSYRNADRQPSGGTDMPNNPTPQTRRGFARCAAGAALATMGAAVSAGPKAPESAPKPMIRIGTRISPAWLRGPNDDDLRFLKQ